VVLLVYFLPLGLRIELLILRLTEEATAHSLSSKQMNFDSKFDELSHKPPSHITQEDARQLQSVEVRHAKDGRPFDESRTMTILGQLFPE
jgi:hypothetical protein